MRLRRKDIEEAESCRFLRITPFSSNAEENLSAALVELKRRDIRIVEKKESSLLPKSSTALHGRLRVSVGFYDRAPELQARTLWHEIVHYCQRDHYGRHRFNASYLFVPRRRWSFEMPAYRQSISVSVAQGASHQDMVTYVEHLTTTFGRKYFVRMTKKDRAITRRILLEWAEQVRGA